VSCDWRSCKGFDEGEDGEESGRFHGGSEED
jgi:hypothetical protein